MEAKMSKKETIKLLKIIIKIATAFILLFSAAVVWIIVRFVKSSNNPPSHICVPESEIPANYMISRNYENFSQHPSYDLSMQCGDGQNSIGLIFIGSSLLCEAVAVSKNLVITARHCVNSKKFVLKFGCNGLKCTRSFSNETYDVINPFDVEYNDFYLMHDIAFIKLTKDISISFENFKPACLPLADDEDSSEMTFLASVNESNNFVKFNTTVVDNEECRRLYTSGLYTNCSHAPPITSYHMCAGIKCNDGGLKGLNQGQSGSPLFTKIGSRNMLTGIVSWGAPVEVGEPDKPSVFVLIKPYIEAILDHIQ